MAKEQTKIDRALSWLSKWLTIIIIGFLVFTGLMTLTSGIDIIFQWAVSVVLTFYLIKETV